MIDPMEVGYGTLAEDVADQSPVEANQPAEWPSRQELRERLAACVNDVPSYRLVVAAMDIGTLAHEHAYMVHLDRLMQVSDLQVCQRVLPSIRQLRDIVAAEAHKRGRILHAGDDAHSESLALELIEEITAPQWGAWPFQR